MFILSIVFLILYLLKYSKKYLIHIWLCCNNQCYPRRSSFFSGCNWSPHLAVEKIMKAIGTLSAMFSRKQCRLPKPSAARHTLSPVAVQERHTMSSCNTKKKYFELPQRNLTNERTSPFARTKHRPVQSPLLPLPLWGLSRKNYN